MFWRYRAETNELVKLTICPWRPSCFFYFDQNQSWPSFAPKYDFLKVWWQYVIKFWRYRAETNEHVKLTICPRRPSCFLDFFTNINPNFSKYDFQKVWWQYVNKFWRYRAETNELKKMTTCPWRPSCFLDFDQNQSKPVP